MIPPPVTQRDCMSAATKRYKYLRKIFKFDQMDFEFAFWQMLYLIIAPQKVYKNFKYRKQTKSQFARDDPAFLVLFAAWLCITSVGFAIVLKLSFTQFIRFLLYTVFVECIGTGVIVATIFWFTLNKYFRNTDDVQDVEWGYTFDVHLNAYFPPLILLHFFLLFFSNGLYACGYKVFNNDGEPCDLGPSLTSDVWFFSRLLGNTFWLVAVLYYIYITFLGYSSLQFLRHTHLIISPVLLVLIMYIITLVGNINVSKILLNYYKHRIV